VAHYMPFRPPAFAGGPTNNSVSLIVAQLSRRSMGLGECMETRICMISHAEISRRGVVQNANRVQIPILLRVIQTVSHHELVGNLKSHIAYVDRSQPALGLVQQRRDPD